jgi:hypothetical protein
MRIRPTAFAVALLCGLTLLATALENRDDVEILTGGESTTVEVNLAPLEPLTPALRAILALYAMRANGGCPPAEKTEDGRPDLIRCPLTTALGLGEQCSEKQLALVREWFKDGIPPLRLDVKSATEINANGRLDWACNSAPYTATHQSMWTSLMVGWTAKDTVRVVGHGAWTAGPGQNAGTFDTKTTFRIRADRVTTISHQETSEKN